MSKDSDVITQKIIEEVFGKDVDIDAKTFYDLYLKDMVTPTKVASFTSGKTGWTSVPDLDAYITQEEVLDESAKHDWLYPTESINNNDDLMKFVKRADFMQTSRTFDSINVFESDDISKSENIYHSQNVIDSKNIVNCAWIWDSEMLMGCTRSGTSTFCIGLTEGVTCSKSYRVYGSHKITNSLFIKSSYDLYECLFCAHLQHKKFCIANMQYDEATYYELKKKILGWLFS